MNTALLLVKAVVTVAGYVLTAPAWMLHEATHYLFAWAAGLDPELERFPGPHVTFELDASVPRDVRWIVSLGPTIIGVAVGLSALLAVSVTWSWETVVLASWWVVYTYPSTLDRRGARGPAPAAEAPQ